MHVIPLPIDLTVCQKRASTFVHSFIHSFIHSIVCHYFTYISQILKSILECLILISICS
ncbi:hypothetical protein VCRA2121O157_50237 [Vibrio crassostreae]|nr:hypothetical protein VCRA2113O138_50235 [Vibrio crassostreae]CAK2160849.1 hypothetical protein VCRA2113O322_60010 [Vibrio crassostreae]CAK2573263.1 hypothetical protein VCRA2134O163_100102 [Vibrio crassostreae]CAK2885926.1 hypothetical protein VCRA2119O149_30023 [Vibrio crassostreae]CAK3009669.1 hypothetical protein VCRA2121O154_50082 [Vibrio crassostreae]